MGKCNKTIAPRENVLSRSGVRFPLKRRGCGKRYRIHAGTLAEGWGEQLISSSPQLRLRGVRRACSSVGMSAALIKLRSVVRIHVRPLDATHDARGCEAMENAKTGA